MRVKPRLSGVRLPTFVLERTLLHEVDRYDLVGLLTAEGLSASRAIANSAVVILLRRHQSTGEALVTEDVAYLLRVSDISCDNPRSVATHRMRR